MNRKHFNKHSVKNQESEASFSRANKNRPREISSKKPVSFFRDVFQLKKQHPRDPRFDDLSGTFKEDQFEENYSFIQDIKKREREELQKEMNKAEDEQRKQEIKFLLQRMKNQDRSKMMKEAQQSEERRKKQEAIQMLKEGKKPYFQKKSEAKKEKLVEMFNKLKKSGRLEKYMEKKRRKIFSKDRRHFYK